MGFASFAEVRSIFNVGVIAGGLGKFNADNVEPRWLRDRKCCCVHRNHGIENLETTNFPRGMGDVGDDFTAIFLRVRYRFAMGESMRILDGRDSPSTETHPPHPPSPPIRDIIR